MINHVCVGRGGVGWGRRVSKICPYSILFLRLKKIHMSTMRLIWIVMRFNPYISIYAIIGFIGSFANFGK